MADELISREAILKKLSRMIDYCETDNKVTGLTALFQVADAIMDCPSVNAVVLPCKVGDTVYTPQDFSPEYLPFVDSGKVFAIGIDEHNTMWVSVRYDSGLIYYHTAEDIGKTVFLTREEAETALEGREDNATD